MQLRIDGCPIYLEQISHHPAIGAYYLYGRGYRLYGQVQPKVNFGLNNVKGFSTRPNYLVFDDGSEIELSFGKMLISGLLFGDRQFNFEDKSTSILIQFLHMIRKTTSFQRLFMDRERNMLNINMTLLTSFTEEFTKSNQNFFQDLTTQCQEYCQIHKKYQNNSVLLKEFGTIKSGLMEKYTSISERIFLLKSFIKRTRYPQIHLIVRI